MRRKYAKWDDSIREIENVLKNDFKLKGLNRVCGMYDRNGRIGAILVEVDGRVLNNGVKWDYLYRDNKFDKGEWTWWWKWDEMVRGESEEFREKLRNYLNKKDESILGLCKDRMTGERMEKRVYVRNMRYSLDWMYNLMKEKGLTEIDVRKK